MNGRGFRPRGSQRGVVLLALVLVLLVASSYVLVANLNSVQARNTEREIETQQALRSARDALLQYAANYPDLNDRDDRGPGFLPCPDSGLVAPGSSDPVYSAYLDWLADGADTYVEFLNDGFQEANCAENTGTVLGRLPLRELGFPGLRDSSGERLWYAVSENFKYNQDRDYLINSETPLGTIQVDSEPDVVAVIIAPGEALPGQARRNTDEVSALTLRTLYAVADQYLEGANAIVGGGDTSFVTEASGDFNDQVIYITRAELVAAIEQRVANEVRGMLEKHRETHGAYPWLAPYADPKAGPRHVSGTHTGSGDSANTLVDSRANFVEAGVEVGDVVWNVTDGSRGVVTAIPDSNTLSMSAGLFFGDENDFDSIDNTDNSDDEDRYVVLQQDPSAPFSDVAGANSTSVILRDANRDFEALGVRSGDVVDNLSDGSSGLVTTVKQNAVWVKSLSGGTINAFRPGHNYRIRSNTGRATGGSTILLVDAAADFITMGIAAGDLVFNVSDNTYALVQTTPTLVATELDLTDLSVDPDVVIDFTGGGDDYVISRYKGSGSTAQGLIPFIRPGEAYRTDFSMQWSATAGNANVVTPEEAGTSTSYNTGRTNWATRTEDTLGNDFAGSVDIVDGVCTWISKRVVDCRGTTTIDDYFTTEADSVIDLGSLIQVGNDGTFGFTANGVSTGATAANNSNGTIGIVANAAAGYVRIADITGQPAFAVAAGDQLHFSVPAERCPQATDCPSGGGSSTWYTADLLLTDPLLNLVCVDMVSGVDFTVSPLVEVGDVIRSGSLTFGRVAAVTTPQCLTYTTLDGGATTTIAPGNAFRIYLDAVEERTFTFEVRFSQPDADEITASSAGNVRKRSVDVGIDDIESDGLTPFVTLEDTGEGRVLGRTTVTIPAAPAIPDGTITVADMDFPWYEDDGENDDDDDSLDHDGTVDSVELPSWFIANRWHELVYIAYSSELAPDGDGTCSAGTDCLTLQLDKNAAQPGFERQLADREALVLLAGIELYNVDVQQDRSLGQLSDYFEDGNNDEDSIFEMHADSTSNNDRVGSIVVH